MSRSTAVVEGALLIRKNEIENGYHPSLRPSRLHIGCDMTRTFDEKRDRKRKQRSFHDDFYNEKSVRVVDWIIPLVCARHLPYPCRRSMRLSNGRVR